MRAEWRDHPRACGEKAVLEFKKLVAAGSPPRVRGKAYQGWAVNSATGITPARAGKSIVSRFQLAAFRDHPRACGEKPAALLA